MKKSAFSLVMLVIPCTTAVLLGWWSPAHATQVHLGQEGLYAHQIAHVFFIFALATLIYWLRGRKLVRESGWRFVQYAAFFFILWNLDAILVHYLDGRNDLLETINAGTWSASIHLLEGHWLLAVVYYVGKMDHLLCVPGIIFLYAGLRQLLKRAREDRELEEAGS